MSDNPIPGEQLKSNLSSRCVARTGLRRLAQGRWKPQIDGVGLLMCLDSPDALTVYLLAIVQHPHHKVPRLRARGIANHDRILDAPLAARPPARVPEREPRLPPRREAERPTNTRVEQAVYDPIESAETEVFKEGHRALVAGGRVTRHKPRAKRFPRRRVLAQRRADLVRGQLDRERVESVGAEA